jgi:hypothetical protein
LDDPKRGNHRSQHRNRFDHPIREDWTMRFMQACVLGGAVAFSAAAICSARFIAVENFEELIGGPISGQNGWVGGSGNVVQADPADSTNQVLAVTNQSTILRKPMVIPSGTNRMVFLRFRLADQLSGSFGLSHLVSPTEFSDFGPELNLTNSTPDLRISSSGTPGVYDELAPVTADTWYNAWLLVNNSDHTTQVWLNDVGGAPATMLDKLSNETGEDVFGFRTVSMNDLASFYIKTGSGGSGDFGPLYLDDIYMEDTAHLNLTNPTTLPDGDFNEDGHVDAADYVVWRKIDGTAIGYEIWRSQFGQTLGSGSATLYRAAVPEPSSVLLLLGAVAACRRKRRTRARHARSTESGFYGGTR